VLFLVIMVWLVLRDQNAKMNYIKLLTVSSILFTNGMLFAQDSITLNKDLPIVTNRPGFSESAQAVYKGGFQIEAGLSYDKSPVTYDPSFSIHRLTVPNLGLLYGVSKNVELRVFGNMYGTKYDKTIEDGYQFEFNDLSFGSKINLTTQKGWRPQLAILINQGVPVKSADKTWDSKALLAWNYTITSKFGIAGNIWYDLKYNFDAVPSTWSQGYLGYTVSLNYNVTSEFGVFGEWYSEKKLVKDGEYTSIVDGGFWYLIHPKFQVDLQGGYGMSDENYFVTVGLSYLLLK